VALIVVQGSPGGGLRAHELARAAAVLAVSGLYLSALYFAGLLISASVQRPATALVLAISVWVIGVAAYPNAVSYAVDEAMPMRASLKAAGETGRELNRQFDVESRSLCKAQLGVEEIWSMFGLGASSSSENMVHGFVEGGFPTRAALGSYIDNARSQLEAYIAQLRQQGNQMAVDALEAALRRDWDTYERLAPQVQQAGILMLVPMPAAEIDRRVNRLRGFYADREHLRIRFADRLWREGWQPVEERMKLAAFWSRALGMLSPAGAFQDATGILAGTDREAYWRFLDQTREYRRQLIAHFEEQQVFSAREWFNDQAGKADLAGLPRFSETEEALWQSLGRARVNLLTLAGFNLLGLLGAHWRFRRCDVR
jgi:hypothetical protein